MAPVDERPAAGGATPAPLDYRSVLPEPEQRERVRARLQPPGRGSTATAIVLALVTLWLYRVPDGPGFAILPLLFFCAALALQYAVRAVDAFVHVVNGAASRAGVTTRWRGWLPLPAIALVMTGLLGLRVPFHAAFLISRPAMERFVQQMTAGTPPPPQAQWVGLYKCSRVELVGGGMHFVTNRGAGFFSHRGFAYFPVGPPATVERGVMYRHLDGPWYEYYYDD